MHRHAQSVVLVQLTCCTHSHHLLAIMSACKQLVDLHKYTVQCCNVDERCCEVFFILDFLIFLYLHFF